MIHEPNILEIKRIVSIPLEKALKLNGKIPPILRECDIITSGFVDSYLPQLALEYAYEKLKASYGNDLYVDTLRKREDTPNLTLIPNGNGNRINSNGKNKVRHMTKPVRGNYFQLNLKEIEEEYETKRKRALDTLENLELINSVNDFSEFVNRIQEETEKEPDLDACSSKYKELLRARETIDEENLIKQAFVSFEGYLFREYSANYQGRIPRPTLRKNHKKKKLEEKLPEIPKVDICFIAYDDGSEICKVNLLTEQRFRPCLGYRLSGQTPDGPFSFLFIDLNRTIKEINPFVKPKKILEEKAKESNYPEIKYRKIRLFDGIKTYFVGIKEAARRGAAKGREERRKIKERNEDTSI
ncbi:hypothetical protein AUJ10_03635 [Candidatus Pacearchaeota archaeon CG1_02_31_27]|nr:MAG: hypothetical protein AUJ10_03635 [Candidatus Pacearchaeota archaeon CG1_02_31_27]PIN91847.1 MAG: hypothetical protein COU55_03650 [Candidatus Pacearchaeota archaeon CG10_big_fil_rev_8_21_14_0_10_31_59]